MPSFDLDLRMYVIYNAWIMENYAAGACADRGRPVITPRRLMPRLS